MNRHVVIIFVIDPIVMNVCVCACSPYFVSVHVQRIYINYFANANEYFFGLKLIIFAPIYGKNIFLTWIWVVYIFNLYSLMMLLRMFYILVRYKQFNFVNMKDRGDKVSIGWFTFIYFVHIICEGHSATIVRHLKYNFIYNFAKDHSYFLSQILHINYWIVLFDGSSAAPI